jgi:hypothetical protein
MSVPAGSNKPGAEVQCRIVSLDPVESTITLAPTNAFRNRTMYSLMLETNEVDGIFPLPAKRPPGYNWLVSRVEKASPDGKPTEWHQYHPNEGSVKRAFPKFGSPTKIQRSFGANGTWGRKLLTLQTINGEEEDVWSVLRRSTVRNSSRGSEVSALWRSLTPQIAHQDTNDCLAIMTMAGSDRPISSQLLLVMTRDAVSCAIRTGTTCSMGY